MLRRININETELCILYYVILLTTTEHAKHKRKTMYQHYILNIIYYKATPKYQM